MKSFMCCAMVLFVLATVALPFASAQTSAVPPPASAQNVRDVQASARMSGANVFPRPTANPATGICSITTSGISGRWNLNLVNINPSAATQLGSVHLHQNPKVGDTSTTPALVVLTSIPQPNAATNTSSGSFFGGSGFNPLGAIANQPMSALNALINAGNVYCDVHINPSGPPFGASQLQGTLMPGLGR